MSTQNLKFIHLSAGSASAHKADTGAIIFEKASGRIAVANGTDDVEYYGGGRVSDATFDENKILTISFNDTAETIKLDFSDTASASGVNKILGALRTDVNALKTSVGTSSDAASETGSVYARIAKNKEDIAANTTDIQANANAIAAINNKDTGILAEANEYTDGKLSALRGTYDGTLQTLRADIDSNDTDIAHLQALHASDGADGKMTVKEEIDAKVNIAEGTTVKKYVDDAVSAINGTTTGLDTRIGALETTVNGAADGDGSDGLVKKVAANTGKLTTLIGTDTDKSVRTISAEEVAKIVAGAPESYDTLKEIADWIANDTTGSTQMANDIAALKTAVGKPAVGEAAATGLYKDIADNKSAIKVNADAIDALEALHAKDGQTMKSVKTEVSEGIAGIAEHSETNDKVDPKTADVVVTVTTKSGSVSGVAVDASILAGKVSAEASRAKGVEDELRADLGTKAEGERDAFTRIKALETAQSSGSLMWSVWE